MGGNRMFIKTMYQDSELLVYEESDTLGFNKISCSRTVKNQTEILNPRGLTLVAIFERGTDFIKQLEDAMEQTGKLTDSFVPAPKLHSTLLGIFPHGKTPNVVQWSEENQQFVIDKLDEFFEQIKGNGYRINFKLNFSVIRPGTLYDGNSIVPFESDGTVIAAGEFDSYGNEKFIRLGNDIASYLRHNLPSVFGAGFKRKFPTIWITLGYFNRDFYIKNVKDFVTTFDKLKNLQFCFTVIRELQLRTFTVRSLDNSVWVKSFT
jgi:hypothetical protein